MECIKKGLCSTCVNDAACTFARSFPVNQCEEFSDQKPPFRGVITAEGTLEIGPPQEPELGEKAALEIVFTVEAARRRLRFN